MTTPGTRSNPAVICAMRMRGEGPLAPKATMCEERIEAPALVPATTTPSLFRCLTFRANGVPATILARRIWLPPVRKMPVTSSRISATSGEAAAARSGR